MTYDLDKNRPLQSWKSGLVDGRVDLAPDAESINRADQRGMAVGPDAIVHGPLRHRAGHRRVGEPSPAGAASRKPLAASRTAFGFTAAGCSTAAITSLAKRRDISVIPQLDGNPAGAERTAQPRKPFATAVEILAHHPSACRTGCRFTMGERRCGTAMIGCRAVLECRDGTLHYASGCLSDLDGVGGLVPRWDPTGWHLRN
jgi:hypothetical protein